MRVASPAPRWIPILVRSNNDPRIERALAAMRADPRRRFTVVELARLAGMSRAAFARRFVREVGKPPLKWLTEHRLHHAADLLLRTSEGLAAIADRVGYASEFALSKAFKRLFGVAPVFFRRRREALPTTPSRSVTTRAAA